MNPRPPDAEDWTLPRSVIPQASWPPIASAEAARLLALGQQLDETQWWPPDLLRAHQLRQLQTLLAHAQSIPFHRERLAAAGIRSEAPASWESFARLSLLTRRDVQTERALLRADRVPAAHGEIVPIRTAGATAMPARVDLTALSTTISEAFALRGHAWRRERVTGKLALISGLRLVDGTEPLLRRAPQWGRPVDVVYPTGPSVFLGIGVETGRQVEWLEREQPEILATPASNLLALAEYCRARGQRLPSLRLIRPLGETVTRELRQACREAWDATLAAEYSAKEIGTIALQCPERDAYHVQSEAAIVEVLDDEGRACAPGETGRVVITPLHNFAMPLLRYAIGDYAEVGTACPCGRGLPIFTRVLGRSRDLLQLPSGERRFALQASRALRDVPGLRQFQIVQRSASRLEVRLCTEEPFEQRSEAEIRAAILARVGAGFETQFAYAKEIPRSKDGTFKEFLRARKD